MLATITSAQYHLLDGLMEPLLRDEGTRTPPPWPSPPAHALLSRGHGFPETGSTHARTGRAYRIPGDAGAERAVCRADRGRPHASRGGLALQQRVHLLVPFGRAQLVWHDVGPRVSRGRTRHDDHRVDPSAALVGPSTGIHTSLDSRRWGLLCRDDGSRCMGRGDQQNLLVASRLLLVFLCACASSRLVGVCGGSASGSPYHNHSHGISVSPSQLRSP